MEDIHGTISTFSELGARDYNMLAVKDTTLRDVHNSVYVPTASPVGYMAGNGAVAVSNYEEPVLSQSQESVSGFFVILCKHQHADATL